MKRVPVSNFKVFLDCDGVLADFDRLFIEATGHHPRSFEEAHGTGAFWKLITNYPGGFFNQLKPIPAGTFLAWCLVNHGHNPTILTGIPNGNWAINQKLNWRMEHHPSLTMTCCASKDKKLAKDPSKTNVLIDDWTKYKTEWEENGDIFVHFTELDSTIKQLIDIGVF